MRRRLFLTSSAVVLTGCAGSDTTPADESDPSNSSSGNNADSVENESTSGSGGNTTDEATNDSTENETDQNQTDDQDEEPTEDEEEEEEEEEGPSEAEQALDRADEFLQESLDVYVGPNREFSDITADLNRVSTSAVRGPLSNAREALQDAEDAISEETPSEVQTRYQQLVRVRSFFYWAGSLQDNLGSIHSSLNRVIQPIYTADTFSFNSRRDSLQEDISEAREILGDLEDDSSPSDMEGFSALSVEQAEAKIQLWKNELTAFESFLEELQSLSSAFSTASSAFDAYSNSNYQSASADFYDTSSTFENASSALDPTEWVSAVGSVTPRIVCICDAMAAGCEEMDAAASSGADGNNSRRQSAEDNAREAFQTCDSLVENVDFVAEFFDIDPDSE